MMKSLALGLLLLLAPAGMSAQETEDLERKVEALQQEITRLKAQALDESRLAELERRLDLLAAELEKARTGGASAPPEPVEGAKGLAPAASKVYRIDRGVSIGGYGEALFQAFADERQDGRPSGRVDEADFLRAVVYVGYKFSDKVLFNSELEFEHGSTGKGGEVSVEFGYLDYQATRPAGFRAGMLLVPMGFLNELHEPPIFNGARRPDVESAILPSTWRDVGAGVFGETGPLQWRAYTVASLNAAGFTAAGIRGGRQSGARSKAEDWALTGRVDLVSVPGLLAGASVFTGDSGQGATVDGQALEARVTLYEGHLQYEWRGLRLRALAAKGSIGDAALVNQANKLTGKQSVGESQYGWYLEAAFDVMTLGSGGRFSLVPFVRYEKLDSQDGVPAGYEDDPATERSVLTAGVGLKPIPNAVLKLDFQRYRNEARTGVNQWNVSVGYLF
jgi:hypothetical protein